MLVMLFRLLFNGSSYRYYLKLVVQIYQCYLCLDHFKRTYNILNIYTLIVYIPVPMLTAMTKDDSGKRILKSFMVITGLLLCVFVFSSLEQWSGPGDTFSTKLSIQKMSSNSVGGKEALMAPVIFPQLYPLCGRISHPPPLQTKEDRYAIASSQCGEDLILYEEVFHEYKEPGVFLEMGALDGRLYSNTYFYEHGLGWKGILIEPNPQNAEKLRRADRPRTAKFSLAACKLQNDGKPGKLMFSKEGEAVATALDLAAPAFKERWGNRFHGNVSVPCIPLQYMIDVTGKCICLCLWARC